MLIEKGDAENRLQAWRLSGNTDLNTAGGRLYVTLAASGANGQISLYKTAAKDSGDLVAQGTSAPLGRVTLTEQNSSGLSGSVYLAEVAENTGIELWASLCSDAEILQAEERGRQLLLEDDGDNLNAGTPSDSPETDLQSIHAQVLRRFYLQLEAIHPPADRYADPLRLHGLYKDPHGIHGRSIHADGLWALNAENEYEVVGLANPRSFREWAITYARFILWDRRDRNSDEQGFSERFEKRAKELWKLTRVLVDADLNKSPDRAVKAGGWKLRRC